ncbi:uncharacterized protein LOC108220494 [Daucus carota subsp. sativus]|uniref:uncharacterized protein LOC108220494 n=1 Tax=Daucus carota subsp. sativus TaxID=79200 RepID=UPI0007EFA8F5|nr:PREDICTED: uncharacterized protein LOC108220494 [Daucus carota subsp. sativus]
MSPGKLEDSSAYYQPLPQSTNPNPNLQNYVVLPIYIPVPHRLNYRRIFTSAAALLLISAAVYVLWPSDPDLSVVRLRLSEFNAHAFPRVSLDIALDLTVKVRNRDVYSLVYDSLLVSIMYRGSQLGFVESEGGDIRARGASYVNATLRFDGIEVLSDAILLIEDMARGVIPIDTVTEVEGRLGFFFFELPLKTKVSCEVDINTTDHTIDRQNCYPQ